MASQTLASFDSVDLKSFTDFHGFDAGLLENMDITLENAFAKISQELECTSKPPCANTPVEASMSVTTRFVTREFPNLTPYECVPMRASFNVAFVLMEAPPVHIDYDSDDDLVPSAFSGAIISGDPTNKNLVSVEMLRIPLQIGTSWYAEYLERLMEFRTRQVDELIDAIGHGVSGFEHARELVDIEFSEHEEVVLRAHCDALQDVFKHFFLDFTGLRFGILDFDWDAVDLKEHLWYVVTFLRRRVRAARIESARHRTDYGMFVVNGMEKGFVLQEILDRNLPYIQVKKRNVSTNSDQMADDDDAPEDDDVDEDETVTDSAHQNFKKTRGVKRSGFSGEICAVSPEGALDGGEFGHLVAVLNGTKNREIEAKRKDWSQTFNVFEMFVIAQESMPQTGSNKVSVGDFFALIERAIGEHPLSSTLFLVLANTLIEFEKASDREASSEAKKLVVASLRFVGGVDGLAHNLAAFIASALVMLVEPNHTPSAEVVARSFLSAGELFRMDIKKIIESTEFLKKREIIIKSSNETLNRADLDGIANIHPAPSFISIEKKMRRGIWSIINIQCHHAVGPLPRKSVIDTLSFLRRSDIPRKAKVDPKGMYKINGSQCGFFCHSKTPDDETIGVVKHLATHTIVTSERIGRDDVIAFLGDSLAPLGRGFENMRHGMSPVPVILNHTVIGYTGSPQEMVDFVRRMRRERINKAKFQFVTIRFDSGRNAVSIRSDAGRLCRPLLRAGILLETRNFRDLVEQGAIEYVDDMEIRDYIVGYKGAEPDIVPTHFEITDQFANGIEASLIPFMNFNCGPRIMFQANMSCQTEQCEPQYAFNPAITSGNKILAYGQRPNCATSTYSSIIGENHNGMNLNIAVMAGMGPFGCNQEDAFLLNQKTADSGRLNYLHTKLSDFEIENGFSVRTDISDPANDIYNGFRRIWSYVSSGDVLAYIGSPGADGLRDALRATNPRPMLIRKLKVFQTARKIYLHVELDEFRQPDVGDKFCARSAQKGVIGGIIPNIFMAFVTDSGETPDIIINPHALPSRKTFGLIEEIKFGEVVRRDRSFVCDATPFADNPEIPERFKALQDGVRMTNPMFGLPMLKPINFGCAFIQQLKQHSRDGTGAGGDITMDNATGQPVGGSQTGGGAKRGGQEGMVIVCHGAMQVLNELDMKNSDPENALGCRNCDRLSLATPEHVCTKCGSEDVVDLEAPSSLITFSHTIESVGIMLTVNCRPKTNRKVALEIDQNM